MKKVLIISYYWPPNPGAGAQRVFSFARYLPEFGFLPYVLTPPTGDPDATRDAGGLHTVVDGWDPTRRSSNKKSAVHVKAPSTNPLAEWVRLNFFIPDTKIGWFRPAYKKACQIIEKERPDILLTSAPPYTVHLVGKALHKRYSIPWVADFRDPWLENHAYNTAQRMPWSLWINRRMEQSVLNTATHITTALESQQRLLAQKANRNNKVFTTINNGYDHNIWNRVDDLKRPEHLYISHFGTIYEAGLDCELLKSIATQIRNESSTSQGIILRLFGNITGKIHNLLKDHLPDKNLEYSRPVDHDKIEELLTQQQLLLLIVNHGATHAYSHPSKVFEYMASGNPILAIGPLDHEVMEILRQHAADRAYICSNAEQVTVAIKHICTQWSQGKMPANPPDNSVFSRQSLTRKLAETFSKSLGQ